MQLLPALLLFGLPVAEVPTPLAAVTHIDSSHKDSMIILEYQVMPREAVRLTRLPSQCTGYCFIHGPRTVTGGKQESMFVRCHYSSGLETYNKWWCRGRMWTFCRVLVRTSGTEQEVTRDRVSIRDNQKDRVFTVTLKGLRREDAGTYWCGIEKPGVDHGAQVKVNVDPGSSNTAISSNSPARPNVTSNMEMSSGSQRRTHYMLLVFVKVPILLVLVSVVLWLRGTRRVPEEQWILVAHGNAYFPRSADDVGP